MKADKFLYTMAKQIHNGNVRQEIMTEYEAHITDCKEALMEQGMTKDEAEEEAVRQMGDPVESGKEMGRLYRSVLDIRMLMFFWGMGVFVLAFAFAIYRMMDANWVGVGTFYQGVPVSISDRVGIFLIVVGFIWSAVEKWNDLGTFYAWAKFWNGGGITNSAIFFLIGIAFLGRGRNLQFMIIMIFVCSLIQLGQRAVIVLYRHKKESELLWEIGSADTEIFPYKGKADIGGKHRKVITYKGDEIPKGAPVVIVALNGMTPIVRQI